MKKLKMHSADAVDEYIESIQKIIPECVTEMRDAKSGQLCLSVDFDILKQILSNKYVEGTAERYRLDWPGKRMALASANSPIANSLRPLYSESVNFTKSSNIIIEGDNLAALKLLRSSFFGRIKLIYIDPPYNTGGDFIFKDKFNETVQDYLVKSKQSQNGQKLVANPESSGRYHSDWLSFILPRLQIARSLLTADGIIVISISDKEVHNLQHLCNEVFGEENHIGTVMWNSTKSVTNTALISVGHTYNLFYAKDKQYFVKNREHFRLPDAGDGFINPDNDKRGPWKADPFQVGGWRPNQQYEIVNPKTKEVYHPNDGCSWKNDYETYQELLKEGRIIFGKSGNGGPQRKRYLSEAVSRGKVPKTWWDDVGTTTNGTKRVKELFDDVSVFDNPKPVELLERIIELCDHTKKGIVLDFFGGSGTTAEAVLKLNSDGAERSYIIVQIAEELDRSDKDRMAVVKYLEEQNIETNIAAICRERVIRAERNIELDSESNKSGFRAFRIDNSCLEDVYYHPDELRQETLLHLVDVVKPDRSQEDLLFHVLVDWGVDLRVSIEKEEIEGKPIFVVGNDEMIACFEKNIGTGMVEKLAKRLPKKILFREWCFNGEVDYINTEQVIEQISPSTSIRII